MNFYLLTPIHFLFFLKKTNIFRFPVLPFSFVIFINTKLNSRFDHCLQYCPIHYSMQNSILHSDTALLQKKDFCPENLNTKVTRGRLYLNVKRSKSFLLPRNYKVYFFIFFILLPEWIFLWVIQLVTLL